MRLHPLFLSSLAHKGPFGHIFPDGSPSPGIASCRLPGDAAGPGTGPFLWYARYRLKAVELQQSRDPAMMTATPCQKLPSRLAPIHIMAKRQESAGVK